MFSMNEMKQRGQFVSEEYVIARGGPFVKAPYFKPLEPITRAFEQPAKSFQIVPGAFCFETCTVVFCWPAETFNLHGLKPQKPFSDLASLRSPGRLPVCGIVHTIIVGRRPWCWEASTGLTINCVSNKRPTEAFECSIYNTEWLFPIAEENQRKQEKAKKKPRN
jgi:hypothetical protein